MYSTILVPLDGSPFAELALPVALALAQRHGATLQLLSVHSALIRPLDLQGAPVYDTTFDEERQRELREYLARTRDRLAGESDAPVACSLVEGAVPGETIAEEARQRGAGLVVMTTHGRGGFTRAWIGSVATELVRTTPVPVLLVRGSDPESTPPAAEPLRVESPHLLVPVDGSALAEAVLAPAIAFGTPLGARYTLLRVVRTAASLLPYDETFWTANEQSAMDAQREAAERYVDGLVAQLRERGLRADGLVVLDADVTRTVLRTAVDEGADLIAMSTHARSSVGRVLLGSATDKVVRAADRPVLVVRPDEDGLAAT